MPLNFYAKEVGIGERGNDGQPVLRAESEQRQTVVVSPGKPGIMG